MTPATRIPLPRIIVILAVLAAALVAALPAGAEPDGVADRRAQAEVARAEMARLGEELTPAIERYNKAVAELEQVEAEIALNKQRIEFTKGNLQATQRELDEKLEQSYRIGEPDIVTSILSQQSITEILAVSELFTRSQTQAAQLVEDLRKSRRQLNRQKRALARAEAEAESLRAQRAAEQAAIEEGIAQQQALVVGLEEEIAQLIAEEQARQERIRQQALQALEAQEQAAGNGGSASDIGIGGSVGSSDGTDYSAVELPPTDGSIGAQAVAVAMQFLGVPYVWGGESPSGFDCSGLTKYAYAQVGIGLTHYTGSQWNEGVRVPADQLLPGDLVFFRSDLGHMGMYIGNGQYIHAPQTGDVVKISALDTRGDYQGAVRPY
jgi:cell wall-associated NlpC family hydrolase